MKITLPPEVVEEVLINELSSFLSQLKEKKEQLENGTYEDFPIYSQNLDEEYIETKRDYKACKRVLRYYGGLKCVADII